jgi:biopolymer transport protein ExbB/TolQ
MGDFSIAEMFKNADPVVQGVMLILLLASVVSWVVIIEKSIVLKRAGGQIRLFTRTARTLENEVDPDAFAGYTARLAHAGHPESLDHAGAETRADYRERVERSMRVVFSARLDRLESGTAALATVGSTSPFVGLFGTVWGIMNSFVGIAATGETTLAVVAPGIAEALSATAMGLVAAIPAVVAFNKINSSTKKITKEALTGVGLIGNALARIRFGDLERSLQRSSRA